jgi:hypothetical protein
VTARHIALGADAVWRSARLDNQHRPLAT